MNKDEFLQVPQVDSFVSWLSKVISGEERINFQTNGRGSRYTSLWDSFENYAWPMGKRSEEILLPTIGTKRIAANATFAENDAILNAISGGLRNSLQGNPEELAAWVKATMIWGGVYKKGNRAWVERHHDNLSDILREASVALAQPQDEIRLPDFRFNSAMTKVYALLLDDFVIYDSRVAAALAWMVFLREEREPAAVDARLRFGCMPANESQKRKANNQEKIRSPHGTIFPYLHRNNRFSYEHAKWNIRANWVLKCAFDKAKEESREAKQALQFQTLREIEAALFVLGYDLRHSI